MKMLEELKKEAQSIRVLFVEDDTDFTKVMEDLLKNFLKTSYLPKTVKRG